MAHATLATASRGTAIPKTSVWPNTQKNRRGLFQRILDAVVESRQRQADREIARYLQRCGGRLTDENEREIERRFLQRPSGPL